MVIGKLHIARVIVLLEEDNHLVPKRPVITQHFPKLRSFAFAKNTMLVDPVLDDTLRIRNPSIVPPKLTEHVTGVTTFAHQPFQLLSACLVQYTGHRPGGNDVGDSL